MMKFVVVVLTLALASELQAASTKQRRDVSSISTYPLLLTDQETADTSLIQSLPAQIDLSQIRPLPSPEVEEEIADIPEENPCQACFAYMADLVEQLTDITVNQPAPEVEEEIEEEAIVAPEISIGLPESYLRGL